MSVFLLFLAAAFAGTVDFGNLKDGQKVKSPFKVQMKVDGFKVRPAGEDATDQTSGHHHLMIDEPATPKGEIVAADATHLHFGKGQTETTLTLPKGAHTLTLQFADGAHRSYGPEMSKTVHITVR